MSETPKPYLHLVRASSTDASDATDASEGAQQAEGVRGDDEREPSGDTGRQPAPSEAADGESEPSTNDGSDTPLNQPLQRAIMYAAVSWVALMVERGVHSVDIQPIARRLYEVSVHYSDADTGGEAPGEGIILRIGLAVEPGLVVRTSVEPVRP